MEREKTANALCGLGDIFAQLGQNKTGDYAIKARQCYKRAADLGEKDAQHNYAVMLSKGVEGKQDLIGARKYYKMSAEQGDISAQNNYALMLRDGEGGPEDLIGALKYFKMLADQGIAEAQFNYALTLKRTKGGVQDSIEARKYYKMAADQGFPKAQNNYANMLYEGEGGAKDLNKAFKYYKMAVEQGDTNALYRYAHMLYHGEGGPKDHIEARKYFKMAADLGDETSQNNYAVMLRDGEGGAKDLNEARNYFQLAAEQGIPEAIMALNHLDSLENSKPENTQEDLEADMEISLGSPLKEAIDSSDEDDLSSTALVAEADIPIPYQEIEVKNNDTSQTNEEIILHSKNKTNNNAEYEKELNQELLEYNAKRQKEISEFRTQKQRVKKEAASRTRHTLTVKRKDYIETCAKPQLSIEVREPEKKTNVAFETLEFVKSIFGQGKINIFSNDDAKKAFADLGCKVENKKGENSTSLSFDLGKERRMRLDYQERGDQADKEEKTKYHNPHGHGDNNLYNALKPHLKRFLMSINKSPKTLQVK